MNRFILLTCLLMALVTVGAGHSHRGHGHGEEGKRGKGHRNHHDCDENDDSKQCQHKKHKGECSDNNPCEGQLCGDMLMCVIVDDREYVCIKHTKCCIDEDCCQSENECPDSWMGEEKCWAGACIPENVVSPHEEDFTPERCLLTDGGTQDAGAGVLDGGTQDAGAGVLDGGTQDAGAGVLDGGTQDAGAGVLDGGTLTPGKTNDPNGVNLIPDDDKKYSVANSGCEAMVAKSSSPPLYYALIFLALLRRRK